MILVIVLFWTLLVLAKGEMSARAILGFFIAGSVLSGLLFAPTPLRLTGISLVAILDIWLLVIVAGTALPITGRFRGR